MSVGLKIELHSERSNPSVRFESMSDIKVRSI